MATQSYQLCMMQNTRIGLAISICMRSISEICLVTALTHQSRIFGNVCKIQQKCQLTLQQGPEYKLLLFKIVKNRVSCNGTLTILPVYKVYPISPPTTWHPHSTALSANLLPERLDLHCPSKFMPFRLHWLTIIFKLTELAHAIKHSTTVELKEAHKEIK